MTKEYMGVSKQVASMCITLGEFPYIRYAARDGFDRVTSKIAALTYEELDRYAQADDTFPRHDPLTQSGPNRCVLLIVDRTIDAIAPLLHEFTYQAMANDLLPLTDSAHYCNILFLKHRWHAVQVFVHGG
jgi:syntaxin-binding protein 1